MNIVMIGIGLLIAFAGARWILDKSNSNWRF